MQTTGPSANSVGAQILMDMHICRLELKSCQELQQRRAITEQLCPVDKFCQLVISAVLCAAHCGHHHLVAGRLVVMCLSGW
jgi:hypothetical protein